MKEPVQKTGYLTTTVALLVGTVILFYGGYRFYQYALSCEPYDQTRARRFADELNSARPLLTGMTVCALDPEDEKHVSAKGDEPTFSGGTTIGCAELDANVRNELFDSIVNTFEKYPDSLWRTSCTFRPHHDLRLKFADGRQIDFSICFICSRTYVTGATFSGLALVRLVPKEAEEMLNTALRGVR